MTTSTEHDQRRKVQRPLRHDRVALRRTREERGLEQADLAALVGCSQPHISDMERGYRSAGVKLLARLAEALDVPIADLMAPAPERTRS